MSRPARFILGAVLLALIALGLARLRLDVDVLNLLPNDLPAVRGLKLYQQNFSTARQLILTLRAPDAAQVETAARTLAEALRHQTNLVREVIWQPPWLERPADSAELMAYLWFNSPAERFTALANRLAPEKLPGLLETARTRLATSMSPEEIARGSYDPFGFLDIPGAADSPFATQQGRQMFANAEGTFRVLFIEPAADVSNYRKATGWLAQIRNVVAQSGAEPACKVRFTGGPVFASEIAGSMEGDIRNSIGGTAIIIGILFWLAHRRFRPLLWLLVLLGVVLLATLAGGALIFGAVSVVSMGFAAILLGLAVDYAVVHYQEALAQPELSIPQIRRAIAPSIFWAATTTIAAFLTLNLGGLPGLAQLGSLVALGVAIAAVLMIFAYLPPLFPGRCGKVSTPTPEPATQTNASLNAEPLKISRAVQIILGLAVLGWLSLRGLPVMDTSADALRPRHSAAYTAMDELKRELLQADEPLWLLVTGRNEQAVASGLAQSETVLQAAVSNHLITSYTLPTPLWANQESQQANRATAVRLSKMRAYLVTAAGAQGFTSNSLALANAMLDVWERAATFAGLFTPTNPVSRWTMGQFSARAGDEHVALGLVTPGPSHAVPRLALPPGAMLSGWQLLGVEIFGVVRANFWKLTLPMLGLVLASLWFAFRNLREVGLSLLVLGLSGLGLLAVMRLMGWSWNLLNLMSVPLVLGTGVDYGIFMQLALRRHGGDRTLAYRSVGRALLLCGGTAVAGFGSLAFSSNAGMASLGQVCAVGIAFNVVISVWLLPEWWRGFSGRAAIKNPSSLYGAQCWRLALWATRRLPETWLRGAMQRGAKWYWRLASHRREVVIRNLQPLLAGDRHAAELAGERLLQNFSHKLADLWRYESGLDVSGLIEKATGWENYLAARDKHRGILFVTPHLGNWEFGAVVMRWKEIKVHAISLAEPGRGFTELRRSARAQAGVETLVVGEDPFGAVEIIRKLEAGGAVALLMDRPPARSAVSVQFCGQDFLASVAAAELARASGCALLPTYLVRRGDRYEAHILPCIEYDRPALRDREARRRLTEEILRAFEPIVRQHPDQWYHFVPVWPKRSTDEVTQ